MTFLELAEKRYSVRSFTNERVSKNDLDKIIKAGYVAPTGCNNQPQRILVINSDESIAKLKNCTKCHFDTKTALLVCYNKDECWYRPYDNEPCGPMDASIVTTHMMLEAAEIGVGTTWVMHFDPNEMKNAFNIPGNIIPIALLTMGYESPQAKAYPGHSQFRPLDEIVVNDTF